jgi:vacuolar-type H+-ATPase subunit H
MDILYLLERLEEVLSAGSRLPFTSRALVDDDECFAIVDQIRLSLPNEIRQARKLNADREALMAETQARADQILQTAQNEAREMARDHHIAVQAEARAHEILAQAQRQAEQMRREADDYVYRVLVDLDRRLDGILATVRNGLLALQPDNRPPDLPDEPLDDEGYGR